MGMEIVFPVSRGNIRGTVKMARKLRYKVSELSEGKYSGARGDVASR